MAKGILHGITISLGGQKAVVPEARPPSQVSGFDVGRTGRRLAAIPSVQTAINALIMAYGNQAVARSRYLALNNPYAASAKETFVAALVGNGIKPSSLAASPDQKTKLGELWDDWAPFADSDGILDFYGLQNLAAGEVFEAGECFLVMEDNPEVEDGIVPLSVKLYQAEMLPYWHTIPTFGQAGNRIQMGIEFSPTGKRVAYHFLTTPPGDFSAIPQTYTTVRIPAERVMHLFKPIRIGQIRGIPFTLSGMVTLAMMDLYDDAELERKRTAALFAGFITQADAEDEEAESPIGALGTLVGQRGKTTTVASLEPGALLNLGPGENVTFSEPADLGGSYEAFQYRMLLRAAAGFGVPYSSFTGDMRQVNYSSMRAGLLEFRRRVTAMQFMVMVQGFARPFWNSWMETATLAGLAPWGAAEYRSNLLALRRVKWLPPKFDWVDPLKDIQAEKLAVDNGFKARSDVIEEAGDDGEATDARILADQNREDELGLRLARFPSGPAAAEEALANPDEADPVPSGDPTPAPAPAKTADPAPGKKPPAKKPVPTKKGA